MYYLADKITDGAMVAGERLMAHIAIVKGVCDKDSSVDGLRLSTVVKPVTLLSKEDGHYIARTRDTVYTSSDEVPLMSTEGEPFRGNLWTGLPDSKDTIERTMLADGVPVATYKVPFHLNPCRNSTVEASNLRRDAMKKLSEEYVLQRLKESKLPDPGDAFAKLTKSALGNKVVNERSLIENADVSSVCRGLVGSAYTEKDHHDITSLNLGLFTGGYRNVRRVPNTSGADLDIYAPISGGSMAHYNHSSYGADGTGPGANAWDLVSSYMPSNREFMDVKDYKILNRSGRTVRGAFWNKGDSLDSYVYRAIRVLTDRLKETIKPVTGNAIRRDGIEIMRKGAVLAVLVELDVSVEKGKRVTKWSFDVVVSSSGFSSTRTGSSSIYA